MSQPLGRLGRHSPFQNPKVDAVLSFRQGLLTAENVHVPVEFPAIKEEHMLFTTKPSEIATVK